MWALWLAAVGLIVDIVFVLATVLEPPYIPSAQIPEGDTGSDLLTTLLISTWLLTGIFGPVLGLGALIHAETSVSPAKVRKKALVSLGFFVLQIIAFCAFVRYVSYENF